MQLVSQNRSQQKMMEVITMRHPFWVQMRCHNRRRHLVTMRLKFPRSFRMRFLAKSCMRNLKKQLNELVCRSLCSPACKNGRNTISPMFHTGVGVSTVSEAKDGPVHMLAIRVKSWRIEDPR